MRWAAIIAVVVVAGVDPAGAGPFGFEENTADATAVVAGTRAGLDGVKIGGYLRPELVFGLHPEAAPADRYDYGIDGSRAGLQVGGQPLETVHVAFHMSLGDDVAVESALLTWRPVAWASLTVGRRSVPFTASSSTSSNAMLFPGRVELHRAFERDKDLGVFATASTPARHVIVSAGAWNGGADADAGRGILGSVRIDVSPLGAMPFEEGDLARGPLRVSAGAGALYREHSRYDDAGYESVRRRDLRASASARASYRGLFVQTEVLRRQVTDSLSARPDVATGWYAMASYYVVAGALGLAPLARVGVLAEDQMTLPVTGTSYEAGLALLPRPRALRAHDVRFAATYRTRTDAVTGEASHRATGQIRMRW